MIYNHCSTDLPDWCSQFSVFLSNFLQGMGSTSNICLAVRDPGRGWPGRQPKDTVHAAQRPVPGHLPLFPPCATIQLAERVTLVLIYPEKE